MQETLYDGAGAAIAYIDYSDDATIYLWEGTPVAYLDSDRIYGFNGKHLGWYEDGIIWDIKGQKNGFNRNTLPVYAQYEPYKSYKSYKPYKSYKEYAHYKPYKQSSISHVSLAQFLFAGA